MSGLSVDLELVSPSANGPLKSAELHAGGASSHDILKVVSNSFDSTATGRASGAAS